jgi:hypothetical protein
LWALKKKERRVVLQSILHATATNDSSGRDTRKRKQMAIAGDGDAAGYSARLYFHYSVLGVRVCKAFLKLVYGVGDRMLKNISKSLRDGVIVYSDKRTNEHRIGKICKGPLRDAVVAYLREVKTIHAMPCPTGRGSYRDKPVAYLPFEITRTEVWRQYCADATPDFQVLDKYFWKLWRKHFPELRIMKKKSNWCDKCIELENGNMVVEYEAHVAIARLERRYLRENIAASRDAWLDGNCILHLSFDFAQAVRLPSFKIQPSSFYFKTGKKIDFFGVAQDTLGWQLTFVLPEGFWPNEKGANCICSMLSLVLERYPTITGLRMNADNCSGQNKNRYLLWFCSYVLTVHGALQYIELSFPIAGHTRMFCDACFGLVKRALKANVVMTAKEMYALVEERSSGCNRGVRSSSVQWRRWKEYLQQFYDATVPGITMMHHFELFKTRSGHVCFRVRPEGDSSLPPGHHFREARLRKEHVPDDVVQRVHRGETVTVRH